MTNLTPDRLRQWARIWDARADQLRKQVAELLDQAQAADAMARGLLEDADEIESVTQGSHNRDRKGDPTITHKPVDNQGKA